MYSLLFEPPGKPLHMENHQMINAKIRLIIFFAAKDGDALYSQQTQHLEVTEA